MSCNEYYVYQYLTEQGAPYYIGKGKGNRINVDHKDIKLPPRDRRVIIQNNLSNEEAKRIEGEFITKYGRKLDGGILDNIKINQWACYAGWKHSEETKRKISMGNLGKKRTPEMKEKYRQPKSDEHCEKIRQANLGRPDDGRYIKTALTKSKQRWYTDGVTTRMFVPGTEISGFAPGRKKVNS